MSPQFIRTIVALSIALGLFTHAAARRVYLPPQSYIDVKVYGAIGNGITDDTRAIRNAIKANIAGGKYLFFPIGTYLVSGDSLPSDPNQNQRLRRALLPYLNSNDKWQCALALIGESQDSTIIKLKNSGPLFQDTLHPMPIIMTGSTEDAPDGHGVTGMQNFIENMTIDVGSGNPGAIGIDFVGSNVGGIRNVLIQSNDAGSGFIGLALNREDSGPALFKNLSVRGFKKGVVVDSYGASAVFDNLWLLNQGTSGIINEKNSVTIRNLTSYNSVPVYTSAHFAGLLTLLGGYFRSGTSANNAIVNKLIENKLSGMYLRDIDGIGSWFGKLVENGGEFIETGYFREFVSHRVRSAFPSHLTSLWLPVSDPIRLESANPSDWMRANVDANESRGTNKSVALQAAIDACTAPILWLAPGTYVFQSPVHIRGNVKKIIGTGVTLVAGDYWSEVNAPGQPLFYVDGIDVTIENFKFGSVSPGTETQKNFIYIQQNSCGTLFLKDLIFNHEFAAAYKSNGGHKLFIENVSGQIKDDANDPSLPAQWYFSPGQKVWASQFNPEGDRLKVLNDGADLWIMGYKSEQRGTEIKTINGGRTEVLGGWLFPHNLTYAESQGKPAFEIVNSSASLVYMDYARKALIDDPLNDTFPWRTHVKETRGAESRLFKDSENVPRYVPNITNSLVPLFSGH